jgi:SAM-dependent methyltransferase
LGGWLKTPPGRYLLAWEQERIDKAVFDIFGYHALQMGVPELDGLRANRMPHRWLADDQGSRVVESGGVTEEESNRIGLSCDFDALPFDSNSLDLVVLPHALELARDPHRALREVERVLMPEGRVVIIGFNPASLWGMRQQTGHARRRLGLGASLPTYLPGGGEFIAYHRLRDWLRLLSFEVEAGRFGCYRPPMTSQKWLSRFDWMDAAGDRWWPVLGAVYAITAVKRVRGMRLVGLAKAQRVKPKRAAAVVTQAEPHRKEWVAASAQRRELVDHD